MAFAVSRAKGRGVLVALNDTIHAAREVVKTNTSSVETFESLNRGPAGLVNTGKITWFEVPSGRRGAKSEFAVTAETNALLAEHWTRAERLPG